MGERRETMRSPAGEVVTMRDRLLAGTFPLHRWFWMAWFAGVALAIWLTVEAWEHPYFPGDLHLVLELQEWHWTLLTPLFGLLNLLGSGTISLVLTAVLVVLFLRLRRLDLAILVGATLPLRAAGGLVKVLAERPRPSDALVHVTERAQSASFPSGHVFNAVLLYGMLIVLLEAIALPAGVRRGLQIACAAVIVLMAPARIYVGAHWPSDTLGGYLWGLLLLALLLRCAWATGWRPAVPEQ